MTTRSTIIFKLDGKKIATYAQHGDANRENIKEKVDLLSNNLFEDNESLTKEHVLEKIKNISEKYDWEIGFYGWSSYIHEINIDSNNWTILFKTFDTRRTTKHNDSGTVAKLLKKSCFKNFTSFKEDKNSLSIYNNEELIGYYNENYINKYGEKVYTYSKFVKSKLIDSSTDKIYYN